MLENNFTSNLFNFKERTREMSDIIKPVTGKSNGRFKMKLPFLKKYHHLKQKHDEYKIFDQDGVEIGSFILQHKHQTYYAEVTLFNTADKNVYVKYKGISTADGYSLEHLLFLKVKPSYRESIFQLKELMY